MRRLWTNAMHTCKQILVSLRARSLQEDHSMRFCRGTAMGYPAKISISIPRISSRTEHNCKIHWTCSAGLVLVVPRTAMPRQLNTFLHGEIDSHTDTCSVHRLDGCHASLIKIQALFSCTFSESFLRMLHPGPVNHLSMPFI